MFRKWRRVSEHSNAVTILFAAGFTLMVALDVALE